MYLVTDSCHVELPEGDAVITRMIQLAICAAIVYV